MKYKVQGARMVPGKTFVKTWCVVFAALYISTASAQQKDSTAIRYGARITGNDLKKHLNILASDEYEGRETGKPGQKKAAAYIEQQYKSWGIPAPGAQGYLQPFDAYPRNSSKTTISINKKEFSVLKDFYVHKGNAPDPLDASEVDFLGYGIEESNYSDYTYADVKGKIVLVLDREPVKDGNSLVTLNKDLSEWSEDAQLKAKTARKKGAKALFVIDEDFDKNVEKAGFYVEHSPLSLEKPDADNFPTFFISPRMAEILFDQGNVSKSPRSIASEISKSGKTVSFPVSTALHIDFHFNDAVIHSENVMAFIEGTDLKDQVIVISGHYDHLGVIDGKVYNGADDDGSGTVSVLELASIFEQAKKEGHGPRRSLLFLNVAGEEKGLLGSSYYTDHPVIPLSNTMCDLNIDMVGRVDKKHSDSINYVYSIGSRMLSTGLGELSESCRKLYSDLTFDYTYDDPNDKNRFYYRSDHYNFAKNGIPVIFYFNGTHADYHRETDEVDKINFELMEKRVKLIFFTAWTLANRDERIMVDVKKKE